MSSRRKADLTLSGIADLHDFTCSITSSPLTQFATLRSALIHDLDHLGVPNAQLLKEGSSLTSTCSQSAAELNSLDLAWNLLMDDKYETLRQRSWQPPGTTMGQNVRYGQLTQSFGRRTPW